MKKASNPDLTVKPKDQVEVIIGELSGQRG
jgi:hypothetical protein